jgi:hypothetical protein
LSILNSTTSSPSSRRADTGTTECSPAQTYMHDPLPGRNEPLSICPRMPRTLIVGALSIPRHGFGDAVEFSPEQRGQ